IFKELKNGNEEKLEELYNKYKKTVYSIAFGILKNKEDAEDIVQIVFSKLYTMDKEKLPQDKEATWLYTVTRNETLQLLKKKNNDFDIEKIYNLEDENSEIEKFIDKESYNQLINKLNNKEKEIVSLKIISNLSFSQISELLGEPLGTIKWRYYKSIYSLRIMLSNLGMFIVTFILGIATFKQTQKTADQEINQENSDSEQQNISEGELLKNEMEDIEINDIETENKTQENIIIEEPIVENNVNYLGYGILGISFIFLIVTIIFAIILKKYQLNLRKKSSK
ncbi:MAG: RNA polymerase sigma factor, partial [Clostridia bacterium]